MTDPPSLPMLPPITVLLIEDDPADARLVREMLLKAAGESVKVEWVERLAEGLKRLSVGGIDAVLLELRLSSTQSVELVDRVQAVAPTVPVIVLTGRSTDESLGIEAVQHGAQDYLMKYKTNGDQLTRVLRYAIERKRSEQQLRQANHELQEAQLQLIQAAKLESVGRLAAGVAHEVKNPLAIILAGTEYLVRELGSRTDQASEVLKDMAEAVRRADMVIKGLLDFSAPKPLNLKLVELTPVIEQGLLLVKYGLTKHHISVIKEVDQHLPLVRLDPQKMEHVLLNIFMNAVDAMPTGGTLTIKTSARRVAQVGERLGRRGTDRFKVGEAVVVTEVSDTGPGIAKQNLAKIYDPFFTTKPTGQGTGLGLAVTKTIIELHGGTIAIRNRKEGGVMVTIMLRAPQEAGG